MTRLAERTPSEEPEELTSGQVAAMFRVDRGTVVRWADAGLIPCRLLPSGVRRFDKAVMQQMRDRSNPTAAAG